MNELGFIIVFSIVLFVVLIFVMQWYMQFCLRKMLQKKHEWLDFILATSYVPLDWSKGNIAKIKNNAMNSAELARFNKKVLVVYLRRLKKLINYAGVSTLMESEDARHQVLKGLRDAGEQWKKGFGLHDAADEFE